MATSSVELREERAALVKQARDTWSEAEKREGGHTEEDKQAFDRAMDDADKLLDRAKKLERLESAESDLDAPGERRSKPIETPPVESRASGPDEKAMVGDFRQWLKTGEVRQSLRPDQARFPELRDTIIGTDAKGGYLVAPVMVTRDLVESINDQVFIRNLATVRKVTEAKKLGIRKLTSKMAAADWTTEVGPVVEDTTMAFDRRDLEPYMLTKLAKMSYRTMYLASDAESIIREELAYAFAITQEKAFLTGDGVSKPLGVFTASASGISTARDVATSNTATALTADGLIDAKYSLKSAYMNDPSLAWIFHRDALKMIRKLKNSGTGEYVWTAGLQAGQPDRILDVPFYMSEYAPNTFTTGLYVGIIGAFRWYWIAEVVDFVIQRLTELYAATNEIGFIGRIWVDGAPILEEAFARVKLA